MAWATVHSSPFFALTFRFVERVLPAWSGRFSNPLAVLLLKRFSTVAKTLRMPSVIHSSLAENKL
jgi:hypothetical protein